MIKESKIQNSGVLNPHEVLRKLENAEHYKEAGIKFYPLTIRLNQDTFDRLIRPEFRDLITDKAMDSKPKPKYKKNKFFGIIDPTE